jgi:uncharacterized protein
MIAPAPVSRALLIALAGLTTACSAGPTVHLGNRSFRVEVADTNAEREIGLMYRDKLKDSHGMLFVFDGEAPQAFWMKNTLIPLDILYFDAEYRFVSASFNTPPCRVVEPMQCPSYPSTGPAKYVLELNAGIGEKLNLKPGDRMEFDR